MFFLMYVSIEGSYSSFWFLKENQIQVKKIREAHSLAGCKILYVSRVRFWLYFYVI